MRKLLDCGAIRLPAKMLLRLHGGVIFVASNPRARLCGTLLIALLLLIGYWIPLLLRWPLMALDEMWQFSWECATRRRFDCFSDELGAIQDNWSELMLFYISWWNDSGVKLALIIGALAVGSLVVAVSKRVYRVVVLLLSIALTVFLVLGALELILVAFYPHWYMPLYSIRWYLINEMAVTQFSGEYWGVVYPQVGGIVFLAWQIIAVIQRTFRYGYLRVRMWFGRRWRSIRSGIRSKPEASETIE